MANFDLVFSDDFGGGYRTENWGNPFHGGVYWNGAWSWNGADVGVRNGVLEVSATRHADGSWTGGGLNTFKAGHTITYGVIEMDVKVPEVQGVMGVVLTWPDENQGLRWPSAGEIDLLETPWQNNMHSSHGERDGRHIYDSQFSNYDETVWNHYKVTWLPDDLKVEVNGVVVGHWTDPDLIPDVAHGIGAMVNVASPNDGWMGPPPDPNGPNRMVMEIDNVRMWQWNGGTGGEPPAGPAPVPVTGRELAGTAGADVFGFRAGDGWNAGGPISVAGFEVGKDKLDVVSHTVDGWTYDPWVMETAEGTVVQWSWAQEETVLLKGVHGVTLDNLTNTTVPPVDPPPVDPPPVEPEEPEEPPVEEPELPVERALIEGGDGKDTMKLDRAFSFDVDPGDGKDRVILGEDHGDIRILLDAGEVNGDKILGFDSAAGDTLVFRGFKAGTEVRDLDGDYFKVGGEKFQLVGVDHLAAGDYIFG